MKLRASPHRSPLLAGLLAIALALPVSAQAQEARPELLGDIAQTIEQVQAELAAIDERQTSDDWMVFESSSRGLIEVELPRLGDFLPAVQALRRSGRSDPAGSALAEALPGLWEATVLLGDAPDWVLDAGGDTATTWLRDRFGHLQTPERKAALYDMKRTRLQAELEALRESHEYFQTEALLVERATTEQQKGDSNEVEVFCEELILGETLVAEDGSATYLGPDIPPIEELPTWCRDALLSRLVGQVGSLPAAAEGVAAAEEVAAAEPVRRGEEDVGWEPDPTIRHARWDGVWEYWGAPTLTLQQVGEYVYGTYQEGDGWMKLAVVSDSMLKGRWYEGDHAARCSEVRDGTTHWGPIVLSFDDTFDSYFGQFGVCDTIESGIGGERAR